MRNEKFKAKAKKPMHTLDGVKDGYPEDLVEQLIATVPRQLDATGHLHVSAGEI